MPRRDQNLQKAYLERREEEEGGERNSPLTGTALAPTQHARGEGSAERPALLGGSWGSGGPGSPPSALAGWGDSEGKERGKRGKIKKKKKIRGGKMWLLEVWACLG